jgi:hypothetical protein
MPPIRQHLERFWTQVKTRTRIVGSLFRFLMQNKMWWMTPIILILILFFMVMIFATSTPLGPFIYAIF